MLNSIIISVKSQSTNQSSLGLQIQTILQVISLSMQDNLYIFNKKTAHELFLFTVKLCITTGILHS